MAVEPLSKKDVEERLQELPGWSLEGDRIARRYSFDGHFQAAAMVVHIAQIQEELNHHSDLTLGYNTVALTVNTHSVGGKVTGLDVELARRIEAVADGHGAR
ncbi:MULTISPECIES: 4a-hydroxytetrahydrobiopterin dehydratase [Streptomyces]|uniref:Putative pterin-4-alpha-carbinolamine dehydratase n=1 Tax=Streptomyces luteosporeus TaxID=173856 RepID=A0ABP6GCK1_9ACTN